MLRCNSPAAASDFVFGREPLIDGEVPAHGAPIAEPGTAALARSTEADRSTLAIDAGRRCAPARLSRPQGLDRPLDSLGLRFGAITGVRRYLRNGYQSWDGSYFVAPGTPPGDGPPAKAPTLGFAMTALLPERGSGAVVLGFARMTASRRRFRFGGTRRCR